MTDYEQFVAMLTRAGIAYEAASYENDSISVIVEGGYSGFCTCLVFAADGSLKTVGAYE